MSTPEARRDRAHHEPSPDQDPAVWWDAFYREGRSRWSGKPNASLVAEVAGMAPGAALDLGCGQGADAIWLAQQGWRVTAVDIAASALETAAHAARDAGLPADAIAWEQRDLATAPPPAGPFDLVTTSFLHSPVELPRTRILREAAATLAPGGTLLIIGHLPSDAHPHHELPAPEQVVAELALPEDQWTLRACEQREVEHAFHGEAPTRRLDGIVRFERRAA